MTIRDMDEEAHLETFGTGEQVFPNDDPEGLRIYLLGGFRVLVGSRAIDDVEWRLRKAKTLVKLVVLRSTGSLWIDVDAFDAAAAEAHRTRDRPPRKGDMMAKIGQPYTSGRWLVKAGNEEAFIERWSMSRMLWVWFSYCFEGVHREVASERPLLAAPQSYLCGQGARTH